MIYVGDSMVNSKRLFGTDGIRGKFVAPSSSEKLAIAALHDERVICSTLMRLVGESLARISDTMPGEGANVVIGWDQRPCNEELVASLTLGLRLAGCSVTHIGICSTPFLHYSILQNNARIGVLAKREAQNMRSGFQMALEMAFSQMAPRFKNNVCFTRVFFKNQRFVRECGQTEHKKIPNGSQNWLQMAPKCVQNLKCKDRNQGKKFE